LNNIVYPAIGAVIAAAGTFLRRRAKKGAGKKSALAGRLGLLLQVGGAWYFVVRLLILAFGPVQKEEGLDLEIFPARTGIMIGSYNLSQTVAISWGIMLVLILAALALRLFLLPRFTQVPKGAQNVIELCVDTAGRYTASQTAHAPAWLSAYIFTVSVYLVACAAAEAAGLRSPATDITFTLALGLCTFLVINAAGIIEKDGVLGRLKSIGSPTPVVFPFRVVSDIAIPVSLACRLFGNMLGGMVVMDLLYSALGSGAVAIPSVIGLFFNVFHPLIQAFIFVTLTLSFVNEAVE